MKKIVCFSLLLMAGCQRSEILREYDTIQQVWYLETAGSLPEVLKEIKFVNFSACKVNKKRIKNAGFACSAPINQMDMAGGVSFSYAVLGDKKLKITGVLDLKGLDSGFMSSIPMSERARKLENELKGEWSYEVTENRMVLINQDKKMTFKL